MLYDCFKHWTRTGRLFIYSDLHFNDEENKAMCPNWISPEEQVAIINKCCHKNDTLLLLGDLGDPEYVKQIKANKVLVTIIKKLSQTVLFCVTDSKRGNSYFVNTAKSPF